MKIKMMILITLLACCAFVAPTVSAQEVPTIRVVEPVAFTQGYSAATVAPTTIAFTFTATGDVPAYRWRYLLVEARVDLEGGGEAWIDTEYRFDQLGADLVDLESPDWSEWRDWADSTLLLEDLPVETLDGQMIYYLLALQVKDVDGVRSLDLGYGAAVHNFRVDDTRTPVLVSREMNSGRELAVSGIHGEASLTVAAENSLLFRWYASADDYAGEVAGYRWGWDLLDPDDPADPGWAVDLGLSDLHTSTPSVVLGAGEHALTIHCRDLAGSLTRATWRVTVLSREEMPTIRVVEPSLLTHPYTTAPTLPTTVAFSFRFDSPTGRAPMEWRSLLIEAAVEVEPDVVQWINNEFQFDALGAALVDTTGAGWSEWNAWSDPSADEALLIEDLPTTTPGGDPIFYLLALQVRDDLGIASADLGYAGAVHNFRVGDQFTPLLTSREVTTGDELASSGLFGQRSIEVTADQEFRFTWEGDASSYGGAVVGYRWGWDVVDPDDDADPGWVVDFGVTPLHMGSFVMALPEGYHVLTIHCVDLAGNLTRATWDITIAPLSNESGGEPQPVRVFTTGLHGCRPNPFNPATDIAFELGKPGRVLMRVIDARGRLVTTLIDEALPVGDHVANWDGRDDAGRSAPAGVYFAQMLTVEGVETTRMMLVK